MLLIACLFSSCATVQKWWSDFSPRMQKKTHAPVPASDRTDSDIAQQPAMPSEGSPMSLDLSLDYSISTLLGNRDITVGSCDVTPITLKNALLKAHQTILEKQQEALSNEQSTQRQESDAQARCNDSSPDQQHHKEELPQCQQELEAHKQEAEACQQEREARKQEAEARKQEAEARKKELEAHKKEGTAYEEELKKKTPNKGSQTNSGKAIQSQKKALKNQEEARKSQEEDLQNQEEAIQSQRKALQSQKNALERQENALERQNDLQKRETDLEKRETNLEKRKIRIQKRQQDSSEYSLTATSIKAIKNKIKEQQTEIEKQETEIKKYQLEAEQYQQPQQDLDSARQEQPSTSSQQETPQQTQGGGGSNALHGFFEAAKDLFQTVQAYDTRAQEHQDIADLLSVALTECTQPELDYRTVANALYQAGSVYYNFNQYQDAFEVFNYALKLYTCNLKKNDTDTAVQNIYAMMVEVLFKILHSFDHKSESEKNYEEILQYDYDTLFVLHKLHGGNPHRNIVTILCNTGVTLSLLTRFAEAINFLKASVAMHKKLPESPSHADHLKYIQIMLISVMNLYHSLPKYSGSPTGPVEVCLTRAISWDFDQPDSPDSKAINPKDPDSILDQVEKAYNRVVLSNIVDDALNPIPDQKTLQQIFEEISGDISVNEWGEVIKAMARRVPLSTSVAFPPMGVSCALWSDANTT